MSEKEYKYVSDNPDFMSEWDFDANEKAGFDPSTTRCLSQVKVWWRCSNGHRWQAHPYGRTRGRNCPFCAKVEGVENKRKNAIDKKGSLADNNPELAKEWHPTKNGDLRPEHVLATSSKKVWWQCKNGHEWEANIDSRNKGTGCAVCSRRRLLSGYNDLATLEPDIAALWHPAKNGTLLPSQVTPCVKKKVWWLGECGHEWDADVGHMTKGGGCPFCVGKRALVGYNDLATLNPTAAKEWHPTKNGTLTPYDVTLHSNKKVWWLCEKGHEWYAPIDRRTKSFGCPICSSEHKTSFPEQAILFYLSKVLVAQSRYRVDRYNEIDVYLPEIKIGVEYDGVFYHTSDQAKKKEKRKEEELEKLGITLIRVKEREKQIAPVIEGKKIYCKPAPTDENLTSTIEMLITMLGELSGISKNIDVDVKRDRTEILCQYIALTKENSILAKNPELAAEWHPTKNGTLLPEHFAASANRKAWWLCRNGHEWEAAINSRNQGVGCPYCAGKIAVTGYNDLATLFPDIAKTWHPTKNGSVTPQMITPKSNKTFWWIGECGHEWDAKANDRFDSKGCPICLGKRVLVGFNDLATTMPNLAAEWHPTKNGDLLPTQVSSGSDKRAWWLGECGHEWETTISSRKPGLGCPYCANQKLLVGFNDLATTMPELAVEWHPTKNGTTTPRDVISGSNKKAWWLGKCGHEWEAVISSRKIGRGCPYCANQRLLVGFNDLATIMPNLVEEWHPTKNGKQTPNNVIAGSNKKAWWLCKNGHEWEAIISSRCGGRGCVYCVGQRPIEGENDLATQNPALAKEWHPTKNGDYTPNDAMPGTNRKVWWLCENGHEWEAVVASRSKGSGCPYCAGKKAQVGINDLATKNPVLAAEWHPTKNGDLTPQDVMQGTNRKVWWLCKNGHEWEASPNHRSRSRGCPICARNK